MGNLILFEKRNLLNSKQKLESLKGLAFLFKDRFESSVQMKFEFFGFKLRKHRPPDLPQEKITMQKLTISRGNKPLNLLVNQHFVREQCSDRKE